MQRDAWQAAKDLFRLALDQPVGDREAFVANECGDASLREEVLRLLRLHDEPSDFLISPMTPAAGRGDPLIGRNLGGFVLSRQIGFGGMGTVYEALQGQPRRRAAVKVLRPGLFAPRMQRRFEYESEILAKLHHPGIAQVFAAGTFEIGGATQSWFAMELIEGPSLRSYVSENALSQRQKLELLLLICDAVQHAHQRGIIHRDLKPDNVLVSTVPQDGAACQPKVLDFGVALMLDTDVHATMHTAAGELVGTLTYMSPEQLSGNSERIDARSDVYALGVIAYELLSGRLPRGAGRASFSEIIRAIEHEEPQRLGTFDASLRGDIEVIIAKALEKDMGRRYQSVAELASDLRHYLNDEPVSARPPTATYQLRKFAQRNRALVGSMAATLVALTAGLILYAREARVARQEADKSQYEAEKATAINNFITNDFLIKLLAAANEPDAKARLPVAELVEKAADSIETVFAGQPLAEAAVRNEIGTIHYNVGSVDKSAEQFERALALWETHLGKNHADTLKAVNNLGQARTRQRRPADAEELYVRALEGRRAALGEDDPYTLVSMNNLAELYRSTGRLDKAESLLRQALESQERVHGVAHKNTITTLGNLGALLVQRGRHEDALLLHRQAHEASRETLGVDHVMTAMTGFRRAATLQRLGRHGEAEPLLLDCVQSLDRSLGPDHGETINARRALARTYRNQLKQAQAMEQLRLALDGARVHPNRFARLIAKIQEDLAELRAP